VKNIVVIYLDIKMYCMTVVLYSLNALVKVAVLDDITISCASILPSYADPSIC